MWTGTVEEVDDDEDDSNSNVTMVEEDLPITFCAFSANDEPLVRRTDQQLPVPSHFRSIESYRAYDESSEIYQEMKDKINATGSQNNNSSSETPKSPSRRQKKNARKRLTATTSTGTTTSTTTTTETEKSKEATSTTTTKTAETAEAAEAAEKKTTDDNPAHNPTPTGRARLSRVPPQHSSTTPTPKPTTTGTTTKAQLEQTIFEDPRSEKEKRKAQLREAKRNKQLQAIAAMRGGGMRNMLGGPMSKVFSEMIKENNPEAAMAKAKELGNVSGMTKTNRKNARERFDQFAPAAIDMARDVFLGGTKKAADETEKKSSTKNMFRKHLHGNAVRDGNESGNGNAASAVTAMTTPNPSQVISFSVEEDDS